MTPTALPLFDAREDVERFAVFSPCRGYRYALGRTWDFDQPPALFVGLNPSTADATDDDPTIRRCIRFARDWGYGGLLMGNLFGVVSSDPRVLLTAPDPVGEQTDEWLARLVERAGVVVAAWGAFPEARERAQTVVDSGVLGSFTVLGLTNDGHPRHPLYMRADCRPLDPLTLAEARVTRDTVTPGGRRG